MGLAWQQGPLGRQPVGRFLTDAPLPERLLYAEPLRRHLRVRFGDATIAESDDAILLHEPARYPVAYMPRADIDPDVLVATSRVSQHRDLGATAWFTVAYGNRRAERAAWQHVALAAHASLLEGTVAFAWRLMDAFFEEDERVLGHAADPYHRIDIRPSSRRLTVSAHGRLVADTRRSRVLYESGFAPRWYVPVDDIDPACLAPVALETFCPYKGVASYYDVGGIASAAWSYQAAFSEVSAISGWVSFEPDSALEITVAGRRLAPDPGQKVIAHGRDRDLSLDEARGLGD